MTPDPQPKARPEPSLAVQSIFLSGSRVLGYLLAFFIPIVLVRVFSQTQFGLYKQALLVAETALPVLNLGMSASLFYFLPRHRRQGHHFILQALGLLWLTGAIGGLTIALGAERLALALNQPQLAGLLPIAAGYVAFSQPGDALLYLPIIDRRPGVAALFVIANEILKLVVAASAALIYRTVSAVLLGTMALAILRALLLILYVRHRGREEGGRINLPDLKRQLAYALPFAAAVLLEIALAKAHQYFVSTRVSADAFAIYATGVVQIPVAALLSTSVAEVLLVRASAVYQAGDLAELRRLWTRSLSQLCALIVPVWIGAEVFAPELIELLFGRPYLSATPVLRIFLLASVLTIIIDHGILRAVGDTRFLFAANAAGLLISLAWMVAAPLTDPLIVAVTGYVLGFGCTRLLGLARVALRLGTTLHQSFPLKALILSILLALAATGPFWLATRFLETPAARLGLAIPAVGVTYAALAMITRLVPRDDMNQLLMRFRRRPAAGG